MKNITVKQHYVPRFYLEHFVGKDSFVHVWNVEKKTFIVTRPKDICYEDNLYETAWEKESPELGEFVLHNQIEKYFSRCEAEFANLQKLILAICVNDKNKNALILHSQEKKLLRRFFANMLLRNPYTMEKLGVDGSLDDLEGNSEIEALKEVTKALGISDFDALAQMSYKKAVLMDELPESYVNGVCHDLEDVALEFFYSKAGGFITSDFPVSFGRDSGIKAENIQTAYFPISPKVAVLWGNYEDLKRRSNRVVEVNTESVIDFNKTFLKGNAGRYKYVFADCKEALEACIE